MLSPRTKRRFPQPIDSLATFRATSDMITGGRGQSCLIFPQEALRWRSDPNSPAFAQPSPESGPDTALTSRSLAFVLMRSEQNQQAVGHELI